MLPNADFIASWQKHLFNRSGKSWALANKLGRVGEVFPVQSEFFRPLVRLDRRLFWRVFAILLSQVNFRTSPLFT